MSEAFSKNLIRVEQETAALAARTASLADFRAAWGRQLSKATRDRLAEVADSLDTTARELRRLGGPSPREREIGELVETARQLGVML